MRFAFERPPAARGGGARPHAAHAAGALALAVDAVGLVLAVLIGNVVANGAFTYDAAYMNRLAENIPAGEVQRQYTSHTGRIAAKLPKDHFYRIDNADTLVYNSSMVQGFPSTSFYFSTMNGTTEFRQELDSRPGRMAFSLDGFDERAMPTALVGTRYYLAKPGPAAAAQVPFGFRALRKTPRGIIYINDHALPNGFVYEQAINRSEYLHLDPVDRQAAMLQGVVIEDGEAPRCRESHRCARRWR